MSAAAMTYHGAMIIRLRQSPAGQRGQITQSVRVDSRVRDIVTRPWPPRPLRPLRPRLLPLRLLEDAGGELLQAGGAGRHAHLTHGDAEQSLKTILFEYFYSFYSLFIFYFNYLQYSLYTNLLQLFPLLSIQLFTPLNNLDESFAKIMNINIELKPFQYSCSLVVEYSLSLLLMLCH